MSALGKIDCPNCGRSVDKKHHNQKFCSSSCKDRYWSRGTRRVSKMQIQINKILNILQASVETSALLLDKIERLEIELDIRGSKPGFRTLRNDFYTHRDQIDHSLGK